MSEPGDLAALLGQLEAHVQAADPADVPEVIGVLGRLSAVALGRLIRPTEPTRGSAGDQLLTIDEVASRTRLGKDYFYRNRKKLPFARRIGRTLRFSEKGLERWLATRGR